MTSESFKKQISGHEIGGRGNGEWLLMGFPFRGDANVLELDKGAC